MAGRVHGAQFFGGWTFDQLVSVQCDSVDNPNNYIATVAYLSNWCDQSALDIPFRHEFKLSGSYTLPYDVQVNAAFQSYAGPTRGTFWSIASTTLYNAASGFNASNCVAPCVLGQAVVPNLLTAPNTAANLTVALQAPGTDYYGRQNQLDLGFRKLFRFGRYQYSGQVDIFNTFNNGYVKTETRTWGTSLGVPTSNLQPRTLRLAVQMRF
jgi:hypothetical protein